mmetsp:Transcript_7029/g.26324  ORF Transcript_7029/g.26324 Transcript_7029/m.26324 type:complete len:1347 (-) Transcript_7029:38-4078(-)|eukprot:CAMPEP_0117442802 /NCGR_PEP_ID=MMETSP0759-20121206/4349_1 /TAXON_ID=63605 /ORGANISM="Percolomonas cosmopolitus, Strain WS" /LENGTH=1346 /DNA_ID=CAMNT_0005234721 /DNA_START=191 /DNA_END=4231 /DNA_ORIENTATION=-
MSFFKRILGKDSPQKPETKEYEPPAISVPGGCINGGSGSETATQEMSVSQQPTQKPADLSAFGIGISEPPTASASGRNTGSSAFSGSMGGSGGSLFGGMQIKTVPTPTSASTPSSSNNWGTSTEMTAISPKRRKSDVQAFSGEVKSAAITGRIKRSNSGASDTSSISSSHSGVPTSTQPRSGGRRRGAASKKIGKQVKQKRVISETPTAAASLDSPASLNRSNDDSESITSDTGSTTSKKLSVIDMDNQLDFGGLTMKSRPKDDTPQEVINTSPTEKDNDSRYSIATSLNDLLESEDMETPPLKKGVSSSPQQTKQQPPPAQQNQPESPSESSSNILQHFAVHEEQAMPMSLHEQLQAKWQELKRTMKDTFQSLYLESSSLQNEKRELFAKRADTLAAIEALKSQVESNEADLVSFTQNEDYDAAEQLTQKIDALQKDIIAQQDRLVTVERLLQQTEEKRNQLPQLIIEQYNTFVEKVRRQEEEQLREYKEFSRDAEIKKTYTEERLKSEKLRLQRMRENVETDLSEVDVRKKKLQDRIDEHTADVRTDMEKDEDISNSLQLEINDLRRRLQKKEAELEKVQEKIDIGRRTIEKYKRKFNRELDEIAKQEKHAFEREHQFQVQQREYNRETASMESTLQEIRQQEESRQQSLDDMKCFVEKSNIFTKMIGKQREHLDRIRKERELFDAEHRSSTKKIAETERSLYSHQDRMKASLLNVETLENKLERFKKQLQKIEKKIPALEQEKQQAAEKRQFREAGRLHKEIKALEEKEEALDKEHDDTQNLLRTARAANDSLVDEEKELQDRLKESKVAFENGYFRQIMREKVQLEVMVDEYQKVSVTKKVDDDEDPEENVMDISSQYNVGLQLLEIELDTVTNEYDILVNSLKLDQSELEDVEDDMKEELRSALQNLRDDFGTASKRPAPVEKEESDSAPSDEKNVEQIDQPVKSPSVQSTEEEPFSTEEETSNELSRLSASEIDQQLKHISEVITTLEAEIESALRDEEYEKCDELQSRIDALCDKRIQLERVEKQFASSDDNTSRIEVDTTAKGESNEAEKQSPREPDVDREGNKITEPEFKEETKSEEDVFSEESVVEMPVDIAKFGASIENEEDAQEEVEASVSLDLSMVDQSENNEETTEDRVESKLQEESLMEVEAENMEDAPVPSVDISKFAAIMSPTEEEGSFEQQPDEPSSSSVGIDLSKFGAVVEDDTEEVPKSNIDISKFGILSTEINEEEHEEEIPPSSGIDLSKFGTTGTEDDTGEEVPQSSGIDLSKFGAAPEDDLQDDIVEEEASSGLNLLSKFNVKSSVQRSDESIDHHQLPVHGVSESGALGGWGNGSDDSDED